MYCKAKKISDRSKIFRNFSFLEIYFIKNVWKVGFQFMLILGLLGMYFDAVVVFVTKSSLFFRLAVAILWSSALLQHASRLILHYILIIFSVYSRVVQWQAGLVSKSLRQMTLLVAEILPSRDSKQICLDNCRYIMDLCT